MEKQEFLPEGNIENKENHQGDKRILISKLVKVMAGVKHIPKNGRNKNQGYDYATEADVSDYIRGHLVSEKIFMLFSIEDTFDREIKTGSGNIQIRTRVKIKYTFLCGETGESFDFICYGDGQDIGDKGICKAITQATKYALMKSFLVPTGDDPDADSNNSKTGKKLPEKPQQQSSPEKPQSNNNPQPPESCSKSELMQLFNQLRIGLVEEYWKYLSDKYNIPDWAELTPEEIKEQKDMLNEAIKDNGYKTKFRSHLIKFSNKAQKQSR